MVNNRIWGAVIGMFVGGLAGLAIVGWLMQVRMGRPLAGDPVPVGTSGTSNTGVPDGASGKREGPAALAEGAAFAVQVAERALREENWTDAARGLDAASRVLRVGMHAAGDGRAPFERAHRLVERTREALQNGNPDLAGRILIDAGPALGSFSGGPAAPVDDVAAYEGSTLIDARGVRIGEIDRFSSAERRPRQARVRLGGWQNFMGIVDLGGREVLIPVDALVFGPAQQVGETMVALAAQ